MDERECRPKQHQRPGCNTHLPFQRDRLLATDDWKTAFNASQRAALHFYDVVKTCCQKLLARLSATATGSTDDIQRLILRAIAGLHHRRRIEGVQWDILCHI